jgi:hypothetical protein
MAVQSLRIFGILWVVCIGNYHKCIVEDEVTMWEMYYFVQSPSFIHFTFLSAIFY